MTPRAAVSAPTILHRDARRWSAAEDARLVAALREGGLPAAVATFPSWSESRVIRRLKRLGLSRRAPGRPLEWTVAEEMKLRRMWGLRPRPEIEAALPGRTWTSIRSRAGKLGLFRQRHVRQPLPEPKSDILRQIRMRMAERAFTATDLQECAEIKRGVLSAWFSARAEPKLRNVERAAEALGGRLVIIWDDAP